MKPLNIITTALIRNYLIALLCLLSLVLAEPPTTVDPQGCGDESCVPESCDNSGGEAAIPDAALEDAIKKTLRISAPSVCVADMLRLTSLTAEGLNIMKLNGLEYATNLTELYLFLNPVSDLTPLSRLMNLSKLDLQGNLIHDLSPLSTLIRLTTLYLNSNSSSDLTPLSTLTKLTTLNLTHNSISDLSALVNNTGLRSGDEIDLQWNSLGLSNPTDPDHQNIEILRQRGATVYHD